MISNLSTSCQKVSKADEIFQVINVHLYRQYLLTIFPWLIHDVRQLVVILHHILHDVRLITLKSETQTLNFYNDIQQINKIRSFFLQYSNKIYYWLNLLR